LVVVTVMSVGGWKQKRTQELHLSSALLVADAL
jgi:hypothetical protein